MNTSSDPNRRPAAWAIALAFALLYVAWGTTYLAIKKGVKDEELPPALFGGMRVCMAGLALLGYLALRGAPLRLCGRDLARVVLTGGLLFVAGNGLITLAERTVPSGTAAILAATTPLWIALQESCWPGGERVHARGWLGLLLGLSGVLLLLAPGLQADPAGFLAEVGPFLVLGSACFWGLGSLLVRYLRTAASHLTTAAWQMIIGGGSLALVGLAAGEVARLPREITPGAAGAFIYLFVVGSLVGFVAFNWLLGHVSATRVGTYAYVNPIIAVLVGYLLDHEELTVWMVAGIAVILVGVGLVRSEGRKPKIDSQDATSPPLTCSLPEVAAEGEPL